MAGLVVEGVVVVVIGPSFNIGEVVKTALLVVLFTMCQLSL